MKIPLEFKDGHLVLHAVVNTKRFYSTVKFVIDTGSKVTFLNVKDVEKMQIPASNLPFFRNADIGGVAVALHELDKVTIRCGTDADSRIALVEEKRILAAVGLRKNKEDIQKTRLMPTILGTDFLLQNKLALYFNPAKNIAYLEKEESRCN